MNKRLLQKKLYNKTKSFSTTTTKPTNNNSQNNLNSNQIRNPDVLNKLKSYQRDREVISNDFKKNLANTTYKKIIYDREIPKQISSIHDLKIDIGKYNDREFRKNLDEKMRDRNYHDDALKKIFDESKKQEYDRLFKYKNEEIPKINQQKLKNMSINDHVSLKFNTNDYYKQEENKINKYKQDIMDFINKMK